MTSSPLRMMSPTTDARHAAEVADLKERIAKLEARLAGKDGFLASLEVIDEFVRRRPRGLGIGLGLFSPDGKQVPYFSRSAEHLFSCTRDQLRLNPNLWLDSIDPADMLSARAAFSQAQAGQSCDVNLRVYREGALRWVRSRFFLASDPGETAYVGIEFEDVTEHRLFEEALRQSEAKYRRIVETANEGILMLDAQWRVTFVNPRLAEKAFLPAEAIIGREVFQLAHPDDRESLRAIAEGRARETMDAYQMRLRLHNGIEMSLTVATSPIVDDAGNLVGLLAMISNTTERARAEQAVRQSEERLSQVLDATSEGIWEWNLQTDEAFFSPRWCDSLGYSPAEIVPHISSWQELVHPDDWPTIYAQRDAYFAGETEIYQCENRLRTKSGRWRWNLCRAKCVARDAEGRPLRMIGVDVDIDQRKRMEQSLSESEWRFRTLAVHSPMGIFQTDLEGNALFVNDRYRTIAGTSAADTEVRGWLRTVHPDDRERMLTTWHEALEARSEFALEYRFLHDDGTVRWVMGTAVPLPSDTGQVTSYLGNILDITHRKQAEEALRASEQRFRMLSNSSPLGIFLSDNLGQIIYANPRLQAISGYEPEDLTGRGFMRVVRPQDREGALRNWLSIAGTTATHNVERKFINRDGEERWVHIRSVPMISPEGAVVGRVGTVEEITDRRQAEEQLRNSEERYRLLAEHSTDVISRHAPDGRVLYASPACRSLLGYEPEEVKCRSAAKFIHPDDAAKVYASQGHVTYRARRKDGQYVWFESTWRNMGKAENGKSAGFTAVSRDVTARVQAIEQLRDSEARMRGILDTAGDGIITINERGIIELFNPGAERLFGYRAEEVLGHDVRLLMPADIAQKYDANTLAPHQFRRPITLTREIVGLAKDGTLRELEMRVGETVIAGRSIFTGILHDITARKRTEKMLRESEKLAATGRIAARIAHEINNPLAGIKNSFLLIKDAIPRGHAYYEYVGRIESEIARIARIVRQMFDLYRPDHVTLREIHLDETIHDVVALLNTIAPAREVTLTVDTTQVRGPVRLPEDSVRQVLYNIIVNAIEASPARGVVRIEATQAEQAVEVSISDQGPGIPADLRSQIYEPFFTTKSEPATGGLGLGLSISRGIVEAMQGTLDFESVPQCGTVFRIVIPTRDNGSEVANG